MKRIRPWLVSIGLIAAVGGLVYGLGKWKTGTWEKAAAEAALMPEPAESVRVAVAEAREYNRTTTTTGTVRALQSITLRNELEGTVSRTALAPGLIVDEGTVLVALDVSVEEAELKAQQAQAALAQSTLDRLERLSRENAVPVQERDQAQAQRDVSLAQIERTRAIMARKTLRAPFRARIGMADLHVGQYLEAGTELTTLQGVDRAVHVDFRVTQEVAGRLRVDDAVEIMANLQAAPLTARIVALDARVDADTRNATVRAHVETPDGAPLSPGSGVRVRVPLGGPARAVAIPVAALRRGAEGDFAFVLVKDDQGRERATLRPVKIATLQNEEVLVSEGLEPGERVAATGSFKLREGVLVAGAPAEPSGR